MKDVNLRKSALSKKKLLAFAGLLIVSTLTVLTVPAQRVLYRANGTLDEHSALPQCPYCDAWFTIPEALLRHIERYHEELYTHMYSANPEPEPPEERYQCPYCDAWFAIPEALLKHIDRKE